MIPSRHHGCGFLIARRRSSAIVVRSRYIDWQLSLLAHQSDVVCLMISSKLQIVPGGKPVDDRPTAPADGGSAAACFGDASNSATIVVSSSMKIESAPQRLCRSYGQPSRSTLARVASAVKFATAIVCCACLRFANSFLRSAANLASRSVILPDSIIARADCRIDCSLLAWADLDACHELKLVIDVTL